MMALGALFGALNTMYSAVASRTREIATLRALGFGAAPVVFSVMIESLALALVGGVVGGLGAYFAFDGYKAPRPSTGRPSARSPSLSRSRRNCCSAHILSATIGLLGGLFPAIRAARLAHRGGVAGVLSRNANQLLRVACGQHKSVCLNLQQLP